MNEVMLPSRLYATGEVQVRSNGDGAKTAPVSIVCSSGDPFFYNDKLGMLVWDHDSVRMAKSKIPLDWQHDQHYSIGYLSNMQANKSTISVSGAIVRNPHDESNLIADSLTNGIPFEASAESHDFELEYVPAGKTVHVNGRDMTGPLNICRNWELTSVAICKYGKDGGTSVSLAASKRNSAETEKVLFVRASKYSTGERNMNEETKASATVEAPVEVVKVEAAEKKEDQVKVETPVKASVVEAVETPKVEAVKAEEAAPAIDPIKEAGVALAASADPRAEFKQFFDRFGEDPAIFVHALFHLCEDQAKNRNVDPVAFSKLFRGKTFDSASDALINELSDFFQPHRSRILKASAEKTRQLQNTAMEKALKALDELTLDDLTQ